MYVPTLKKGVALKVIYINDMIFCFNRYSIPKSEIRAGNSLRESEILKKGYEMLYSNFKKGFQNPNKQNVVVLSIRPLFCLYVDRDDRGESKC